MKIGYDPVNPANASWSLTGSGAAFVTDDSGLDDGWPQRRTRISFTDTVSQTIAETVGVRRTWGTAFVPRGGCILGVERPSGVSLEGLKLEIRGKRPEDAGFTYALGGNSLTQRLVQLPDGNGSIGLFWLYDAGLDPIHGYEILYFNDIGGATTLEPSEVFDTGEISVRPMVDMPIKKGWDMPWQDPTIRRRTDSGSQSDRVPKDPWRRLVCEFAMGRDADVFRGGLADGMDWQMVQRQLLRGDPVLLFPRWTNAGVFDADTLHRWALFAEADVDGVGHVAGPWWRSRMEFDEIPA